MQYLRVVLVVMVAVVNCSGGFRLFPGIFDPSPFIPQMNPEVLKVTSNVFRNPLGFLRNRTHQTETSTEKPVDEKPNINLYHVKVINLDDENDNQGSVIKISHHNDAKAAHVKTQQEIDDEKFYQTFNVKDNNEYNYPQPTGFGDPKEEDFYAESHNSGDAGKFVPLIRKRESTAVADLNNQVAEDDILDHTNPRIQALFEEFGARLTPPKRLSYLNYNNGGYESVVVHDPGNATAVDNYPWKDHVIAANHTEEVSNEEPNYDGRVKLDGGPDPDKVVYPDDDYSDYEENQEELKPEVYGGVDEEHKDNYDYSYHDRRRRYDRIKVPNYYYYY